MPLFREKKGKAGLKRPLRRGSVIILGVVQDLSKSLDWLTVILTKDGRGFVQPNSQIC